MNAFSVIAPRPRAASKLKFLPVMLVAAVALVGWQPRAHAEAVVDLGSAANFAILAGSGITFTGGATTITGDMGTHATTVIDGAGTFNFVTGQNHAGDAFTQAAKSALAIADTVAAIRASPTTIATELGRMVLAPGVYTSAATTFGITTGNLTLNGGPNAVFIFQMGSTLDTAGLTQVLLTGGAQASNVFWQVGGSATLGIDSVFA